MKKDCDKKNKFISFYLRTFCFKEFRSRLKMTFLLSIVFTVSAIFTIINSINNINQRRFVDNCDFKTIGLTNEAFKGSVPCFKASILTEELSGGNQFDVNLFLGDVNCEVPFFGKKNRLKGSFSTEEDTIWLTYNTAAALESSIGSKVRLLLENKIEERELYIGEYTVDGILKPFCGDFSDNAYDENLGFAYVFMPEDEAKSVRILLPIYLSFDSAIEIGEPIQKEHLFKESKLVADYVGKAMGYIFPVFAAIISLVVIYMEFMQYYKHGIKRFAVLNVLGVKEKTLSLIHFIVFFVSCLTAAVLSSALFRIITMQFIDKYVPIDLTLIIFAVDLLISVGCIGICIITKRRSKLIGVLFDDAQN